MPLRRSTLILLVLAILAMVAVVRSVVVVDASEAVYVTEFGRPCD